MLIIGGRNETRVLNFLTSFWERLVYLLFDVSNHVYIWYWGIWHSVRCGSSKVWDQFEDDMIFAGG
jgi:hypothetical protein